MQEAESSLELAATASVEPIEQLVDPRPMAEAPVQWPTRASLPQGEAPSLHSTVANPNQK